MSPLTGEHARLIPKRVGETGGSTPRATGEDADATDTEEVAAAETTTRAGRWRTMGRLAAALAGVAAVGTLAMKGDVSLSPPLATLGQAWTDLRWNGVVDPTRPPTTTQTTLQRRTTGAAFSLGSGAQGAWSSGGDSLQTEDADETREELAAAAAVEEMEAREARAAAARAQQAAYLQRQATVYGGWASYDDGDDDKTQQRMQLPMNTPVQMQSQPVAGLGVDASASYGQQPRQQLPVQYYPQQARGGGEEVHIILERAPQLNPAYAGYPQAQSQPYGGYLQARSQQPGYPQAQTQRYGGYPQARYDPGDAYDRPEASNLGLDDSLESGSGEPVWDREPYEYEMPRDDQDFAEEDAIRVDDYQEISASSYHHSSGGRGMAVASLGDKEKGAEEKPTMKDDASDGQLFVGAALGDAPDTKSPACLDMARAGPDGDGPMLCRHYQGDSRKCQLFVKPTQSCWHRTVDRVFLNPSSTASTGPRIWTEDPNEGFAFNSRFFECAFGSNRYNGQKVEAPYRIPYEPVKSSFAVKPTSAYFWNFVHIPRTGGDAFARLLADMLHRMEAKIGVDGRWDGTLTSKWSSNPLVDFTSNAYANTMWHYTHRLPPTQFSGKGMEASYLEGRRAISKGALSMGACDAIDAPCAYLTLLREPLDRYMSLYAYLCLEGGEEMTSWTEEWRAEAEKYRVSGCPATPLEFMNRVPTFLPLLAPGASPDTTCSVEAAKRNLAAPCMRYVLLERLDDGLNKMRDRLPDFANITTNVQRADHDDSETRLTPKRRARLDSYLSDSHMMAEIRSKLAGEFDVYKFAAENYETQWAKDFQTC